MNFIFNPLFFTLALWLRLVMQFSIQVPRGGRWSRRTRYLVIKLSLMPGLDDPTGAVAAMEEFEEDLKVTHAEKV